MNSNNKNKGYFEHIIVFLSEIIIVPFIVGVPVAGLAVEGLAEGE